PGPSRRHCLQCQTLLAPANRLSGFEPSLFGNTHAHGQFPELATLKAQPAKRPAKSYPAHQAIPSSQPAHKSRFT
ncbi:MAG: hypothetical protein ACLP4V_14730, partial [Methylocella sp.]